MKTHDAKNSAAKPPVGRMSLRASLVGFAAATAACHPLQSFLDGWPLAARVAMAAAVGGIAGTIASAVAEVFARRKPGQGCA